MTFDFKNIGDLLKNNKLQQMVNQTKDNLTNLRITGEAAGGDIKVTMNGLREVLNIEINRESLADLLSQPGVLEELLSAAFNAAIKKVEEETKSNLPDLNQLFGLNE